jgi:hypothetical protein
MAKKATTTTTTDSIKLTDTAVRFLKASTLGISTDDEDLKALRAAADQEDHDLPSDQLACHVLLREIRKRRMAAMADVKTK